MVASQYEEDDCRCGSASIAWDLGALRLLRDTAEVHLSPKGLELLRILVEKGPTAVSKAELHDRLWPGTFVTEANLASLAAELRRALDDQPKAPRFIQTVHGFGYAFCAEIEGASAPAQPAGTCWILWRDREIPLQDGENVIGRDPDTAVRLNVPSVSRRHARIVVSPEGATLEDLGSKNGTLLHRERVSGIARLSDLDELQIGSGQVIVRILRGVETDTDDRRQTEFSAVVESAMSSRPDTTARPDGWYACSPRWPSHWPRALTNRR